MKTFIKKNYRITLICLTIIAVASIGFSYAFGAGEYPLLTRDELSEKVTDRNMFLSSYPVGSTYISSTNVNPGTIYGGTWTLIDKEFSSLSDWQTSNDFFVPNEIINYSEMLINRVDHEIMFRIIVRCNSELTDTDVTLGHINWEKIGVTKSAYDYSQTLAASDSGNASIIYLLENETGDLMVLDVIGNTTKTVSANQLVYFQFTYEFPKELMLDEACDKFYWKRTA